MKPNTDNDTCSNCVNATFFGKYAQHCMCTHRMCFVSPDHRCDVWAEKHPKENDHASFVECCL